MKLQSLKEADRRHHNEIFDDTRDALIAKLAAAYVKMAQLEAKDEVNGQIHSDPDQGINYWTKDFVESWMQDIQGSLAQQFESAVRTEMRKQRA